MIDSDRFSEKELLLHLLQELKTLSETVHTHFSIPENDSSLTTEEVCKMLKIHPHTARKLACRVQLGGSRGQYRYPRAQIEHQKFSGKMIFG
jgi:Helix-turn-helix domain